MNIYIIKTIIEFIVLAIAYFIVIGLDERITILEKEKTNIVWTDLKAQISNKDEVFEQNVTHKIEPSFKDKIAKEKKRIGKVKPVKVPFYSKEK